MQKRFLNTQRKLAERPTARPNSAETRRNPTWV